jgi:hypothetical protein
MPDMSSTLTPGPAPSPRGIESRSGPTPLPAQPAVEIVIPVYNEQHVLRASVERLCAHLRGRLGVPWALTIADNASTDGTLAVAHELAAETPEVYVLHLAEKGRGRALRAAWSASRADVVAYMDVDLSTDLDALPALLGPLLAGVGDMAIGSRLAPGAQVTRSIRRELISRAYNVLLRPTLQVGFSDAQCGFKAVRREVLDGLLDEVRDEQWFFDTELLYRAQRRRLAIREVPVRWVEDSDSRVAIASTAWADAQGILRLRREARRERSGHACHPCAPTQAEGGREPAPSAATTASPSGGTGGRGAARSLTRLGRGGRGAVQLGRPDPECLGERPGEILRRLRTGDEVTLGDVAAQHR